MHNYGYLVLLIAMAGVFGVALWCLWRRSASGGPTPLLDYLLLWPLIFRAERQSKKPTRRWFVVVGILVYFAVIVAGQFLNVHRHS